MLSIKELTPVTVCEYNKMSRHSCKKAKEVRTLMLDLLAKAYEGDECIKDKYYNRANDILSIATQKYQGERLYKAIMKELDEIEKDTI